MFDRNYISFSELLSADYNISDIYAERERWQDGALFRKDRPRKTTGFIFLI